MSDKEIIEAAQADEVESQTAADKKKRNPQITITIVISIALAVMFVIDLVLFLLNMLQWYIFLALLIMYIIVFPFALLVVFRSKKTPECADLRKEVEAELLKNADSPDPTHIFEE